MGYTVPPSLLPFSFLPSSFIPFFFGDGLNRGLNSGPCETGAVLYHLSHASSPFLLY
jgi:hypothetical protein